MADISPARFLDVPEMKFTAAAKLLVYGGNPAIWVRLMMLHREHIHELLKQLPITCDQGGMVVTDTHGLFIVDPVTPLRRRCDVCVDTEFEGIQNQHLSDLGIKGV